MSSWRSCTRGVREKNALSRSISVSASAFTLYPKFLSLPCQTIGNHCLYEPGNSPNDHRSADQRRADVRDHFLPVDRHKLTFSYVTVTSNHQVKPGASDVPQDGYTLAAWFDFLRGSLPTLVHAWSYSSIGPMPVMATIQVAVFDSPGAQDE